jgi:hypothetical protein
VYGEVEVQSRVGDIGESYKWGLLPELRATNILQVRLKQLRACGAQLSLTQWRVDSTVSPIRH